MLLLGNESLTPYIPNTDKDGDILRWEKELRPDPTAASIVGQKIVCGNILEKCEATFMVNLCEITKWQQ
jgi:hypothetical protein